MIPVCGKGGHAVEVPHFAAILKVSFLGSTKPPKLAASSLLVALFSFIHLVETVEKVVSRVNSFEP